MLRVYLDCKLFLQTLRDITIEALYDNESAYRQHDKIKLRTSCEANVDLFSRLTPPVFSKSFASCIAAFFWCAFKASIFRCFLFNAIIEPPSECPTL